MRTWASIMVLAVVLCSACATPGQKREKAEAEAAVSSASAAVSRARLAGGETYAGPQMRSAENDLRAAKEKLKAGSYLEAARRARLASGQAATAQEDAEAALRRASAPPPTPAKSKPTKKKPAIKIGR